MAKMNCICTSRISITISQVARNIELVGIGQIILKVCVCEGGGEERD